MKSYEAKDYFSMLLNNTLEYETFSGKMKTSLRFGIIDISAHLKIIKDEKMQLSFQAPILGEAFRVTVSSDSLMIVDRVNKQFVAESIEKIQQSFFDFNLQNLQSLFTNQLFLIGKNDVDMADYSRFVIEQNNEAAVIKTKDKNIDYTFTVDYTNHIRQTQMTGSSGKTSVDWSYAKFSTLDQKQLFPMQMGINVKSDTNQFSMNFAFSKIDLNDEIEIDLNIPKKYNRITLAQAIILINNLKQ